MPDDPPVVLYANGVSLSGGPFDIVLDFGFQSPEHRARKSTEFYPVARVAMSVSHARSMLPMVAKLVAEYERQFGTLPAPGFDTQSKE
jgi:hypothetical protein